MEQFDIDKDSVELKRLVSIYDSDIFLAEIVELLKYGRFGRIPYRPFNSLRVALLKGLPIIEEWNKIIGFSVRVKAGYYDALLSAESAQLIEPAEGL